MMNENKSEVEIILSSGKSFTITMYCDCFSVVTDASGGLKSIKYSSNSDTKIVYIDGTQVAAIVQRAAK